MVKEKAVFLYIVTLAGVALSFVLYGESDASEPLWPNTIVPAGSPDPTQMMIAILTVLVLCSVALLFNLADRGGFGKAAFCAGFLVVLWATGPCSVPMVAALEATIVGTCKQEWKVAAMVQAAIVFALCIAVFQPGFDGILVIALMMGFSIYILRLMDKLEKSEQAADDIAGRAEDMRALLGSQRRMAKSTEHVSRLEERNRLAARIHDEIGHGMSGSILLLEGADMVMDKEPEKARETIRKVTENLRGSVEEIRKVLHEERTAGAEVSLARIENGLAEFETDHPQVRTRLDTEGDMGSVGSAVWACVYENMVEALTNVLKHSAATMFRVSLKNSGALLRVEFADNGGVQKNVRHDTERTVTAVPGDIKRTVPAVPWQEGGIGLQNMEERAAMCHGRCFFRHEPDGFHIVMTFPRREGL